MKKQPKQASKVQGVPVTGTQQYACIYCHAKVDGQLPATCGGCDVRLTMGLRGTTIEELVRAALLNGYKLEVRFTPLSPDEANGRSHG